MRVQVPPPLLELQMFLRYEDWLAGKQAEAPRGVLPPGFYVDTEATVVIDLQKPEKTTNDVGREEF